jgi:hypothetical protein
MSAGAKIDPGDRLPWSEVVDRECLVARADALIQAAANLRAQLEASMEETKVLLEKLEYASNKLFVMRHPRRGDE